MCRESHIATILVSRLRQRNMFNFSWLNHYRNFIQYLDNKLLHCIFHRYAIMLECWQQSYDLRPSFESLRDRMKDMQNRHKVCKWFFLLEDHKYNTVNKYDMIIFRFHSFVWMWIMLWCQTIGCSILEIRPCALLCIFIHIFLSSIALKYEAVKLKSNSVVCSSNLLLPGRKHVSQPNLHTISNYPLHVFLSSCGLDFLSC